MRTVVYRFAHYVMLLLVVMALGACTVFSGRETAGDYVDDATITANIKGAILADPDLSVTQISVETMQGVVQLSGFVDSRSAASKAESIARRQEGVRSVRNNLIVRSASQQQEEGGRYNRAPASQTP